MKSGQTRTSRLIFAKRMVLEAMEQTRDLSLALRQSEAEGGIEPALSELLEETLPPEVSPNLEVEGEETLLPPRVRDQMFLILREAVRNTIAHSGTSTG